MSEPIEMDAICAACHMPHTAESGCEAWLLSPYCRLSKPFHFCPFFGAPVSQPEKP